MRRLGSIRLLAVALAAGSMIAVPMVSSASAATPTSCAGDKTVTNTKNDTATSTLTKCVTAAATGGSGKEVVNFKNVKKITAKVTWNKTGTTTLLLTEKGGTKAQNAVCAKAVGKGALSVVSTGSVTGGTGKAATLIPKKSKFSETACYSTKNVVTLYPKSKVVF